MSEVDQLYLDNIDEYVHDQDKIVTYKWLSLTLGVHVNTAKQMLFHYLEHKRKESSAALHATFLLSGKSVDHGRTCHKVCVVREEELEDAKSRLSAVGSVHVYSVHKALLRDSAPLFGVDYDAVKSNLHQCNRFSAIHCSDAVPLSKAELQQSRESRQPPPPQAEDTAKPQTHNSTKPPPKPKGIMGIFASKTKTESRPESKTESRPESKTESRPESKTESRPETKPEPTEEPLTEAPKPAPKPNPMANFFGNQTKKPVQSVKEESSSSTAPTEQRPPQASREQRPPQASREQRPLQASREQRPPQASREQRPLQASRDQRSKSKRVESDSDEEPQEKKKRRRIRKPQSDSSDEEVIPDSPLQTKTPPSPELLREEERVTPERAAQVESAQTEIPTTKTRKRRRVLKSKTFMDEEGCIVTEKVYESESYSEDEEAQTKPGPNPGPRPGPKAASVRPQAEEKKKRGASSAKSTKQASIMGFFNKK